MSQTPLTVGGKFYFFLAVVQRDGVGRTLGPWDQILLLLLVWFLLCCCFKTKSQLHAYEARWPCRTGCRFWGGQQSGAHAGVWAAILQETLSLPPDLAFFFFFLLSQINTQALNSWESFLLSSQVCRQENQRKQKSPEFCSFLYVEL